MRGDDGAGPAAVKHWVELFPDQAAHPDVGVEILELLGIELLTYLETTEQVLIVDAVTSGAVPGVLHWLEEKDLAEFGRGSGSAHGWGVAETLALGRWMQPDKMPDRVNILGIEAGDFAMGDGLSPEVTRMMVAAAEGIASWVGRAGIKGIGERG
jgi:hydrogenase maturation protease